MSAARAGADAPDADRDAEIERLRARVAELEGVAAEQEVRLLEVEDWANRSVAAAQERVYWLDRWHLDLNRLMERPGAGELRAAIRAIRAVYRWLAQLRSRLAGRA